MGTTTVTEVRSSMARPLQRMVGSVVGGLGSYAKPVLSATFVSMKTILLWILFGIDSLINIAGCRRVL